MSSIGCKNCGTFFSPLRKGTLYCSSRCVKSNWKNKRKAAHNKTCSHCSIPFVTGRSLQKFCTFSCQQKANTRLHPEWSARRRVNRRIVHKNAIFRLCCIVLFRKLQASNFPLHFVFIKIFI